MVKSGACAQVVGRMLHARFFFFDCLTKRTSWWPYTIYKPFYVLEVVSLAVIYLTQFKLIVSRALFACKCDKKKSKKLLAVVDSIMYHASVYPSHKLTSSSLQISDNHRRSTETLKRLNISIVNTNRYSYSKMHKITHFLSQFSSRNPLSSFS